MATKIPLFFLFLTFCHDLTIGQVQQSSFQVRLTNSGLDYVGNVAMEILTAEIPKLQIPDIKDGDITATNFRITQFIPPTSKVNLQGPNIFSWTLANAGIGITAKVKACKKIFGKGLCAGVDVSLVASAVNFQTAVTLGRKTGDSGRPYILNANCHTSIGDISLKTGGGVLGSIINLFRKMVERKVKPTIEKTLSDHVVKYLMTKVNQKLESLKIDVAVDGGKYNLDYGLAADPIVTSSGYLEVDVKGQITSPLAPTLLSPYPFTPLADHPQDLRMVNILISDKIINDLLFFAHSLNKTNFLITEDTPKYGEYLKFHCNGKCLGNYVPDVDKLYPNTTAAELFLTTTIPPTIHVNSDGTANFNANITLNIFVPTSSAKSSILHATLSLNANLFPSIANGRLIGHLNLTKMNIDVIESQLIPWVEKALQSLLIPLIEPVIEQKVNAILATGLPLPAMAGVTLSNPVLRLMERTLQIESDVIYSHQ